METRKVQRLGPSTLAMTLPAEWAAENGVEKGDEVSVRPGTKGTLTVLPEGVDEADSRAVVRADDLDAEGLERAVLSQYVLGRRVIEVVGEETALSTDHINAVYRAESQLMGLGVVEETPDSIAIRCSVDPADFTLDNLLERLENTGSTMRGEAIDALVHDNPDLARRALNRERQANKIFVLLLRLIFSAYRNPALARSVGLEEGFPLVGYRSIAKNLELTADNAEDVAETVVEEGGIDLEAGTVRRIRELADDVDEVTGLAVRAAVERDYDATVEVRERFRSITDREREILADLPEMDNAALLEVREVLVSLQQTAQYAMRNAEIAANIALDRENDHVTID
jgi:phosphate uptake regulator